MAGEAHVLDEVRAAIHKEPRLPATTPVVLGYEDGTLTLEGEVPNVAVKKLLLERAAAHPAVTGIIDRLRVVPGERMGDKQVRDHVSDALGQEPAFAELTLEERVKGEIVILGKPPTNARGRICVSVQDGVVTLEGDAPSLAHKRLAGVLAWWVPGSRDVINGLGITPPEEDSDDEIADAVRMVLEKDPFVDASKIRVGARRSRVRLEGLVPTRSERDMAEFDAWYVFGVDDVENRIEVRA
ncbi:MAG: BON domain-containing protein [Alphaproteobacteria bacterium]